MRIERNLVETMADDLVKNDKVKERGLWRCINRLGADKLYRNIDKTYNVHKHQTEQVALVTLRPDTRHNHWHPMTVSQHDRVTVAQT